MSDYQNVFKRVEKKYIVTEAQRAAILNAAENFLEKDKYYFTTICSVYYDTPNKILIRNSIDKPEYKEKIRLRSYGTPNSDSEVFLELKKKYEGVVYKRRIAMKYDEVEDFISGKVQPHTQIEKELAWSLNYYKRIQPSVFISYDRTSFCGTQDKSFRLTFDTNLIYRQTQLYLDKGIWGESLLDNGLYIMEVKSPYAMPLWLSKALDDMNIRTTSFSKYGNVHMRNMSGFEEFKMRTSA